MAFKLVRIDALERNVIELSLGTFLIGNGKLLGCDDDKVAFNHGVIKVTKKRLFIEVLHENKFYITRKDSISKEVFTKGKIQLRNGDSFGLLRTSYWYEVLQSDADAAKTQKRKQANNNHDNGLKNDAILRGNGNNDNSSETLSSTEESSDSRSDSTKEHKAKRKRINFFGEPREPCADGAACYSLRSLRRDYSSHKADYSHPRDPDWPRDLSGAPACRFGAKCMRTGPRHPQRYRHPEGWVPTPPQYKLDITRPKKCFWVSRHSIIAESDSDSSPERVNVRTLRKRVRQPKPDPEPRPKADSEPEEPEDPYASDGSEDYVPSSEESGLYSYLDY